MTVLAFGIFTHLATPVLRVLAVFNNFSALQRVLFAVKIARPGSGRANGRVDPERRSSRGRVDIIILVFLMTGLTGLNGPAYAMEAIPGNRVGCCSFLNSQQFRLVDNERFPSPGPVGSSERIQERTWDTHKSYLVPALLIPGFILALNRSARIVSDEKEDGRSAFAVTPSIAWNHLVHGPWVIDNDNFGINQLGHPYQGATYHNISRSSGLGYWESAGFTFAGSLLWEIAGERTKPSLNDQVASGIAGSFLGEPLFRMASLLLERERPGFWRELGAALISPPTGFNRFVFGDRFQAVFPSRDPAIFWSAQVGAAVNTHTSGSSPGGFERNEVAGDFIISYGLPGKPGYRYRRPFDYFQFGLSAVGNVEDPLENVITRGLLFGSDYEAGDNYRGVWGLYGSYDYVSPHTFRVSTTAVSLGTTWQWWLSRSLALQGSVIAGLGYGAGGDISGVGQRTYHYGATGRAVLELNLLLGDLAAIGTSARLYHVHDALSTMPRGTETIGRFNAAFTVRVHGPHAVGLQYRYSFRSGEYANLANQHQQIATLSLTYTYLSDTRFGAVEWRGGSKQ